MILNINIGVLGHVDSGKTSIVKSLSTISSTASFDKNPQSKARGITLDLGFSSFTILKEQMPARFHELDVEKVQFTLVDCPGHASLMKTIIGGSQIIDLMILVIDASKGIQTQTAECLIIGEIVSEHLLVVLNKIDLLSEQKRSAAIEKLQKRLSKTFSGTKFGSDVRMVPVAARPGGTEAAATESADAVIAAEGMDVLVEALLDICPIPVRSSDGPFQMAVDHCFGIRGQGTVMTGTVISGAVTVGDTVEIPALKENKRVKSMQMFRQPVVKAVQGDRVGLCVTQFDPKLLERGAVCSPGALPTIYAGIVPAKKIAYFKTSVKSKSKFHVSVGHETVMGRLTCFTALSEMKFSWNADYVFSEELLPESELQCSGQQFLLLEFERPVNCPPDSILIGSRLDADIHGSSCRLAFHGRMVAVATDASYAVNWLPELRVFKSKVRSGVLERTQDEYTGIVRDLFKKQTNLEAFVGLRVELSSGERGVLEGGFGQSGKCKVRIPEGFHPDTLSRFSGKKSKGRGDVAAGEKTDSEGQRAVQVHIHFKRYLFDPDKKMMQ